ncbi:unnamed protein product, partial [Trichogramma brassicae]
MTNCFTIFIEYEAQGSGSVRASRSARAQAKRGARVTSRRSSKRIPSDLSDGRRMDRMPVVKQTQSRSDPKLTSRASRDASICQAYGHISRNCPSRESTPVLYIVTSNIAKHAQATFKLETRNAVLIPLMQSFIERKDTRLGLKLRQVHVFRTSTKRQTGAKVIRGPYTDLLLVMTKELCASFQRLELSYDPVTAEDRECARTFKIFYASYRYVKHRKR